MLGEIGMFVGEIFFENLSRFQQYKIMTTIN